MKEQKTLEGIRTAIIPLTQGKHALVDEDDYERVMEHKWRFIKGGYAYNRNLGYMHRFIMSTPDDKYTDHINRDTLDNRKRNLRISCAIENSRNSIGKGGTSSYKGVCWVTKRKKWLAQIKIEGKSKHIGYFDNEISAAIAYDRAAIEYFGEFAYTNFTKDSEQQNAGLTQSVNQLQRLLDAQMTINDELRERVKELEVTLQDLVDWQNKEVKKRIGFSEVMANARRLLK